MTFLNRSLIALKDRSFQKFHLLADIWCVNLGCVKILPQLAVEEVVMGP